MNRRQFLASTVAPAVLTQSRAKRNVLLLIADDLGLHTGAYGDQTARTPNLDRLASEGVRFTNAYCTTASCSTSRSVIHSGLHNHANGQYGHAHDFHHFAYLPHVRPVSSLLKDAGYRTGVVGKMHVNPIERFRWDLDSRARDREVADIAARARDFIAGGDGPWFLQVGYGNPHRVDRGFANRDYRGVAPKKFGAARIQVPVFLPDNAPTRQEIAEYYEAANRLDQGVGMMLDVLRQTGQFDRTLVLFMSDNGMPFPNAKTNLYDAGTRLPFVVRSPAQSRRGLVNHGFVSYTDVTPTILEWAGAKPPDYPLHGRSFLHVLEKENSPERDCVFFSHTFHELTMYYPTRGIRTRRYKYLLNLFPQLRFPFSTELWTSATWQSIRGSERVGKRSVQQYLRRPAEELYDIAEDPAEIHNLAGSPEHGASLAELRGEVMAFRKRTDDPWLVNDQYR